MQRLSIVSIKCNGPSQHLSWQCQAVHWWWDTVFVWRHNTRGPTSHAFLHITPLVTIPFIRTCKDEKLPGKDWFAIMPHGVENKTHALCIPIPLFPTSTPPPVAMGSLPHDLQSLGVFHSETPQPLGAQIRKHSMTHCAWVTAGPYSNYHPTVLDSISKQKASGEANQRAL